MADAPLASPLRYDPSVETATQDEAAAGAALNDAMRGIMETTLKDYGHAIRGVHAKSHALLEGELRVLGTASCTSCSASRPRSSLIASPGGFEPGVNPVTRCKTARRLIASDPGCGEPSHA